MYHGHDSGHLVLRVLDLKHIFYLDEKGTYKIVRYFMLFIIRSPVPIYKTVISIKPYMCSSDCCTNKESFFYKPAIMPLAVFYYLNSPSM